MELGRCWARGLRRTGEQTGTCGALQLASWAEAQAEARVGASKAGGLGRALLLWSWWAATLGGQAGPWLLAS